MIIMGIETSCDETGISIYSNKKGLIIDYIYSQSKIHSKFGGVIPEIASKNHAKKIIPLIKNIIKKKNIKLNKIDLISYTEGPGLCNCLIIGVCLAKTISLIYNIPSVPINHVEAHIMSVMLNKKKPKFPFISLVVSGGHTLISIVKNYQKYKIIGTSLDDSAGETLDKIAKLIGLKYPGGKEIYKLSKYGKNKINLVKPLMKKNNFNFSFSGLKTQIYYYIKNNKINFQTKANIAFSVQECITDILIKKIKNASDKYKIKNISISGGVASNKILRKKIKNIHKKKIFLTKRKFCTDNAAMIAYLGYIKRNKKTNNLKIKIKPRFKIIKNFKYIF